MKTTKILTAEMKGGKLQIQGVYPTDIQINCNGEADSNGFVIFGKDVAIYIANTQPDLISVISALKTTVEQVREVLTVPMVQGSSIGQMNPTIDLRLELINKNLDDLKLI
jgi:hypothetical protein